MNKIIKEEAKSKQESSSKSEPKKETEVDIKQEEKKELISDEIVLMPQFHQQVITQHIPQEDNDVKPETSINPTKENNISNELDSLINKT